MSPRKKHCMEACQDLLNQHETEVSWIVSLPVMRYDVTAMSQSQNGSPQDDDVNSPSKKKLKIHPSESQSDMCCLLG